MIVQLIFEGLKTIEGGISKRNWVCVLLYCIFLMLMFWHIVVNVLYLSIMRNETIFVSRIKLSFLFSLVILRRWNVNMVFYKLCYVLYLTNCLSNELFLILNNLSSSQHLSIKVFVLPIGIYKLLLYPNWDS